MNAAIAPYSDWEEARLGTFGRCIRGVGYDPDADLSSGDRPFTARLLRSNNVQNGRIERSGLQYVHERRVSAAQELKSGDIVICMANGSRALVGKAALFEESDGQRYTFGAFMGAFRTDRSVAVPRFVSEMMRTHIYRNWLDVILSGSSINNLRPGDVEGFATTMPGRAEQRAIADVLGDADDLMATLERLIAKKQAIKQGTMQQLLTGRTRLPGFTQPWGERASFEYLCVRATGYWGVASATPSAPKRVQVITAGDIAPDGRLKGSATRYFTNAQFAKARCMADDLVVTSSGNGLGKTAHIGDPGELAASNFVRILRPRSGVSGAFLAQVMRTSEARGHLDSNTATSAYPNLMPSFFTERWIPNPSSSEQLAIAAVLGQEDAEIEAIQARRDKARAIKIGMMQQLLAGRVRLPVEAAS